jgi:hypothetical protein
MTDRDSDKLPATRSAQRVSTFLEKVRNSRPRLAFMLDATASRQPTWDAAVHLQGEMLVEAGRLGTLELQAVYFRGFDETKHSRWTTDPREIANFMRRVFCEAGETQIAKALVYVKREHEWRPITAAVYVGDMCEEEPDAVIAAACDLGVPLFVFQEGDDRVAEPIFRRMAEVSNGAYCKFDSASARQLGDLLRAVAAFAAGGLLALTDQRSEAARVLLTQMKKREGG